MRTSLRTFVPAAVLVCGLAVSVAQATDPVLSTQSSLLNTALQAGTSQQDIIVNPYSRGSSLEGGSQSPTPCGFIPAPVSLSPRECEPIYYAGVIDLRTAGVTYNAVDLALPTAGVPVCVGRVYSSSQGESTKRHTSNGLQGFNWSQTALPEIAKNGAGDVVYLSDAKPSEVYSFHNAGQDGGGGSSYIDELICRDRDKDVDGSIVREERIYYVQNWRHDVVALVRADSSFTSALVERIRYDAYGRPSSFNPADVGRQGGVIGPDGYLDNNDVILATTTGSLQWYTDFGSTGGLGLADGTYDTNDGIAFIDAYYNGGNGYGGGGFGVLSGSEIDNRVGYAGYRWDPTLALGGSANGKPVYHVRFRVLDSQGGNWLQPDPLKYLDGTNYYQYCSSDAIDLVDMTGLCGVGCQANSDDNWTLPRPFHQACNDPEWIPLQPFMETNGSRLCAALDFVSTYGCVTYYARTLAPTIGLIPQTKCFRNFILEIFKCCSINVAPSINVCARQDCIRGATRNAIDCYNSSFDPRIEIRNFVVGMDCMEACEAVGVIRAALCLARYPSPTQIMGLMKCMGHARESETECYSCCSGSGTGVTARKAHCIGNMLADMDESILENLKKILANEIKEGLKRRGVPIPGGPIRRTN